MTPKIIKEKYIPSRGYWFNVVQVEENKYIIVNTKRKENRIDRDGIEVITTDSFNNENEAKQFLDNMK